MKICSDCKHFVPLSYELPICTHPESYREPIYGHHASCVSMRSSVWRTDQNCGEEGKWFEQAESEKPDMRPGDIQIIPAPVVYRPWWKFFGF